MSTCGPSPPPRQQLSIFCPVSALLDLQIYIKHVERFNKTLKLFLSLGDILWTFLSLLTSLWYLCLSSSLFWSLADIFTSRRFIFCLQGAISHPPTGKGQGSREGSGGGNKVAGVSVEPRSGKRMELNRQRGGEESGWHLVCSMWLPVSHQVLLALLEDPAGAARCVLSSCTPSPVDLLCCSA